MRRGCGVLLHISSLPDGRFSSAREFIDFLSAAGVRYWQTLAVGPTGYGDSPYSALSSFAGNPKFIDPNRIVPVDDAKLKTFITENKYWAEPYAVYMAIKETQGQTGYLTWSKDFRDPKSETVKKFIAEHKEQIRQHLVTQVIFFEQWAEVKKYANSKGIEIIGDVPIYPAMDSADVWAYNEQFDFADGVPAGVAGVPPDYFNEDGQHWGNPLYNFKQMSRDRYKWWVARMKHMQKLADIVRIDHFRAFDTYYKIPFGAKNARVGVWQNGPGIKIFNAFKTNVPDMKIILEDLGNMVPSVYKLRDQTGLPGMRVMQFGFDGNEKNEHLPVNYPKNCVAYIGTHDNDTLIGFLKSCGEKTRGYFNKYLASKSLGERDKVRLAFENILKSRADIVVLCMQDLLFQGSEHRMNIPGVADGNWKYRVKSSELTDKLSGYLKMLIERSGR